MLNLADAEGPIFPPGRTAEANGYGSFSGSAGSYPSASASASAFGSGYYSPPGAGSGRRPRGAGRWEEEFNRKDCLLFGIPALLYCFDTNFQYLILHFISPAELSILWNFLGCCLAPNPVSYTHLTLPTILLV